MYADAEAGYGMALTMLGRPDEALDAFARALAAYETVENYFVLGISVGTTLRMPQLHYRPERVAERERLASTGEQALARAWGAGMTELPPAFARLSLHLLEGRWDEARVIARDVARARPVLASSGLLLLGIVAREQGEADLAWGQVRAILPDGPGAVPGEVIHYEALAVQRLAAALALDAGDLATARRWLEAHDRWLDWSGAVLGRSDGQGLWASFHRLAGEPGRAREAAERALALAEQPRQPLALLAAHRLLGELDTEAGQFSTAHMHLNTALALTDACAAPYERALTLLSLAKLQTANRAWASAAGDLAEARALLEPLEARPALARADTLAARLGDLSSSSPAVRLAAPFGLTAREAEVLELVTRGLGNRVIAERLSLSRRTVEQHLRSIYDKLGVENRTAAARVAVERGLAGGGRA